MSLYNGERVHTCSITQLSSTNTNYKTEVRHLFIVFTSSMSRFEKGVGREEIRVKWREKNGERLLHKSGRG